MKSKGLTYGLLVVVGLIWYQVFIRVKSNVTAQDDIVLNGQKLNAKQIFRKREDFKLAANYRDPFSGNMNAKEEISQLSSPEIAAFQNEPKPPKPTPPPFIWPSIKYYGMVRETSSSKPLTVLAIDGEYYKLRQGESVLDDIILKKVYRDSVVVLYKKRTRLFYKTAK